MGSDSKREISLLPKRVSVYSVIAKNKDGPQAAEQLVFEGRTVRQLVRVTWEQLSVIALDLFTIWVGENVGSNIVLAA